MATGHRLTSGVVPDSEVTASATALQWAGGYIDLPDENLRSTFLMAERTRPRSADSKLPIAVQEF